MLSSRLRKEVIPRIARLHVTNVAKNIIVSVYRLSAVDFVVVRKDKR